MDVACVLFVGAFVFLFIFILPLFFVVFFVSPQFSAHKVCVWCCGLVS